MSISIEQVEHVAKLARLELTQEEKQQYMEQMNTILKHAELLNGLNTDNVSPTSHPIPLVNVMRDDEVRPSLPMDKVFRNAPEEEDGHFKVPAVLE